MTIKVLHIITTLRRGGAERQLVNLVSNSNRAEFEHVVCYLRPPIDFAAELERAGHEVVDLRVRGEQSWLAGARKVAGVIRERKPDLIQTWLFEADMSTRLSQIAGPRVPVINTLHLTTYDPETIRAANWSRLKMGVLQRVDRWTARAARPLFVACSEAVKRSAVRSLGVRASDVRVIYNSIDQATMGCGPDEPQRLRGAANIPEDAFVFISVGRLQPQKGHDVLVRAFQQVTTDFPDAYLVLVGEGEDEKSLVALARELGVAERVRFLGRRADVGACLEMADAFVFPSLFEGFPLAPIEAMLKRLPCIVTNIEPHLELFTDEENGLLVAPGSERELAAAMTRVCREPELRRQLGERAHALATERFDSRSGLLAWEELYRELVPWA